MMNALPADDKALRDLAAQLGSLLAAQHLRLALAESCTGGWVSKALTDIAGSSAWLDQAVVTYSNEAKQMRLGVQAATLDAHGAVSRQTAAEMAAGVLRCSHADLAIAVTGIAGPGGAVPGKPVGTVWFAWARRGAWLETACEQFPGDRERVRRASVAAALAGMRERLLQRPDGNV